MDKRIVIIGCGPGAADMMTLRGKNALDEADVVAGSKRLLSAFGGHHALGGGHHAPCGGHHALGKKKRVKTILLETNYRDALEEAGKVKEDKKIAFLVSGDPVFYSLGEAIIKRFGKENCEVIPGVSSFQYAFCRLKESWKDYKVFSFHGQRRVDIERIFRENDRFILFLDPEHNLKFIKRNITPVQAHGYTFHVASNLSMPNENISRISFDDFDGVKEESLSVLIVRRDNDLPLTPYGDSFYGVGVGPGEPELMTLKALRVLQEADIIFAPKARWRASCPKTKADSLAREIVEKLIGEKKETIELEFPMIKDEEELGKRYRESAGLILEKIREGKRVAYLTIGDPLLYSTYIYLLNALTELAPGLTIETIPGIPAYGAVAARFNFSLAEKDEKICICPVPETMEDLRKIILGNDTVVIMKVAKKLSEVAGLLKEMGLLPRAVFASRVGLPGERLINGAKEPFAISGEEGYLSTIIVRKGHDALRRGHDALRRGHDALRKRKS